MCGAGLPMVTIVLPFASPFVLQLWRGVPATRAALSKLLKGEPATSKSYFLPVKPWIAIKTLRRSGKGALRDFMVGLPKLIWKNIIRRNFLLLIGSKKSIKIDIDVNVNGGGVMGQATATRTAIARGLVEYFEDEELKAKYRTFDRSLLVNDPRRSEPKHPLGRGARKKRQKSYR